MKKRPIGATDEHGFSPMNNRIDRVFAGKEGGLVVDYIGIAAELNVLRALFHGFDYSGFKTNPMLLLPAAANHILGMGSDRGINGKKRFLDAMAAANVAYRFAPRWTGRRSGLACLAAGSSGLRPEESNPDRCSAWTAWRLTRRGISDCFSATS